MRRRVLRLALVAAGLAAAGGLVVLSGVVPIGASSRHWPVTRWFLELAMRRSIATHSLGVDVPALDAPGLILHGAGAYATSCAPCHGSPDTQHPRVAAGMTPHPPYLGDTAPTWEPQELFTIIKEGVKFTGMPAWPAARRDDEIWAVVAFVRALPGLDAAAYRQLAYGPADAAPDRGAAQAEALTPSEQPLPAAAATCVRCHGVDGQGRGQPEFPRLAGQRRAYLLASLDAYARGDRPSGFMEPVAYGLDAATRETLADYFARLPATVADLPEPARRHDPAAIERGAEIARRGDATRRLASCVDCHGPSDAPRREEYPNLAGQRADYLIRQLELFRAGVRGGAKSAHIMHHVAPRLTTAQVHDVAQFFASLAPEQADAAASR